MRECSNPMNFAETACQAAPHRAIRDERPAAVVLAGFHGGHAMRQ